MPTLLFHLKILQENSKGIKKRKKYTKVLINLHISTLRIGIAFTNLVL